MKIQSISIESEQHGPILGGTTTNDNSDIDVYFDNGDHYYASAFTYKNIEWLRQQQKQTGEYLNGKYFWSVGMLLVESLKRPDIEAIVYELFETGHFFLLFQKVESTKTVWVFNGSGGQFPSAIFEDMHPAEQWIQQHALTGTLTQYPVNMSVLDWAEQEALTNMHPEKLKTKKKKKDPIFIANFTTASMKHFHYENGKKA